MKNKLYTILGIIIAILLIYLIGFYIGKTSVKIETKTKIEYIKSDPIIDTITVSKPVESKINLDTLSLFKYCINNHMYDYLIPEKEIISEVIKYEKVDTMKILSDWLTKRNYSLKVFDIDTVGKLVINQEIQYNKLIHFDYQFTPIKKYITNTKEKKRLFEPYIGIGLSTKELYNSQVGIFFRGGLGIGYQYITDFNQFKSHGLNILFKF